MNLTISGHHVVVTEALREYLTHKLDRIRRHFDHVIDIAAILSVDKLQQKAEVTLHVRGKDIHCESIHANLYAAIDELVDKLDRQVIKYKTHTRGFTHAAIKHLPVDLSAGVSA
jgi:putative sigma-54 modulation protein